MYRIKIWGEINLWRYEKTHKYLPSILFLFLGEPQHILQTESWWISTGFGKHQTLYFGYWFGLVLSKQSSAFEHPKRRCILLGFARSQVLLEKYFSRKLRFYRYIRLPIMAPWLIDNSIFLHPCSTWFANIWYLKIICKVDFVRKFWTEEWEKQKKKPGNWR